MTKVTKGKVDIRRLQTFHHLLYIIHHTSYTHSHLREQGGCNEHKGDESVEETHLHEVQTPPPALSVAQGCTT
ncbi:hypothetical protein EON63_16400 [archaeon]|nr:MAG: hypothetical protein EON63_16400 [archaeon]